MARTPPRCAAISSRSVVSSADACNDHLMDVETVRDLAERLLDDEIRTGAHEVLVTRIWEFDTDWLVTYNSREFIETGELGYSMPAVPIIVSKDSGSVRFALADRPVEQQIPGKGTVRWDLRRT